MSRSTMGLLVTGLLVGGALVAAAMMGGPSSASPWAGSTPSQTQPLIVALCHGENQPWPESLGQSYFEFLFSETEGSTTIADYWRDISHGNFSIEGSQVLEVQLDMPRDAIGDRDDDDFDKCRDGVDAQYDIDWGVFAGPVVIKPQTTGQTETSISADDTEVQVKTVSPSVMDDWPSPPFTLVLTKNGSLHRNRETDIENVRVTAVSKDYDTGIATFTIEREREGYRGRTPPAKPFGAGTTVKDISDIYGSGRPEAVVSVYSGPSTINHELGHFLGFDHSRKLSTAGDSYGDCFDIMSTVSCASSHYFEVPVDYPGGTFEQISGPGMTSILLDQKGWIAGRDTKLFCQEETTYSMRGLGVDGSAPQQVRVPGRVEIRDGVMSDYITVELRSQRFAWDQGIPHDAFVLHLKGDDGVAYLVDDTDAGGREGMVAGDRYEFTGDPDDPLDDRHFVVNGIDEGNGTGQITVTNPTWSAVFEQDCIGAAGAGTGSSTTTTTEDDDTTTTTDADTTTTTDTDATGAACLVSSTWLLDSQAYFDVIVEVSAEQGAPFPGEIRHEGGTHTLAITEDGSTTLVKDAWSLSINTPEGTFYATLDGVEQGLISYDDTTIDYVETSSTLQVQLEVEIEGTRQALPSGDQPVETEVLEGSATYECVGDTLTIFADTGGIEIVWTRIG